MNDCVFCHCETYNKKLKKMLTDLGSVGKIRPIFVDEPMEILLQYLQSD